MQWTPYCGPGSTPADAWLRWNADPVLLALGVAAFLALWRPAEGSRTWLVAAFLTLAVSFVSPLCALASALFGARTLHHLLLVAAAAPLLARALPLGTWGPARSLALATAAQTAVFWAWHAPDAYASALSNDAVYWAMQLSLLGSAVWFWSAIRGSGAPAAVVALVLTTVQMGLLGALIAFAGQPLYAPHLLTTQAWGVAPIEDQQMGGLLMWAPALGLYLAAALIRVNRLLSPPAAGAAA